MGEPPAKTDLHASIFGELERKLRESPWKSGASEAHGLLTALACLGVREAEIRSRSWLFGLDGEPNRDIIEGLYGMVYRDLDDPALSFSLLLPPDSAPFAERAEAVADWCQGFLQGIYHVDGELPANASPQVHEAVADIRDIGHLEVGPGDLEQNERALMEVIEYLRVAVQLIREELQPAPATPHPTTELN